MNNNQILEACVVTALKSTCQRSKCGAVIIGPQGELLSTGFNSPAGGESRRCETKKEIYNTKVTDKTCCVHAEQRAIIDGLRNGRRLQDATLYFIRLDNQDNPMPSGRPYCTLCSKLALDSGLQSFALFHDLGSPTVYPVKEYNIASFAYSAD